MGMLQKNRSTVISVGISMSILLSAFLYLRAAENAGKKELRDLCEKNGYPQAYKEASSVGYYDSGISCLSDGCWEVLLSREFQYIEVHKISPRPYDVMSEEGYYRVSRMRLDSGKCNEEVLRQLETWHAYKGYVSDGYCVAIEKLDAPTAEYGLFSEKASPIRLDDWFGSVIYGSRLFIKDMKSEDIIAEQYVYQMPKQILPKFSSFSRSLHCQSRQIAKDVRRSDVINVDRYVKPI